MYYITLSNQYKFLAKIIKFGKKFKIDQMELEANKYLTARFKQCGVKHSNLRKTMQQTVLLVAHHLPYSVV
jgi:hypothetical protein